MIHNVSDGAWRDIMDSYLRECLEYCFPELGKLINWNKPVVSLDKELQAISRGVAGKCLSDKLYKLFLKDGREQWFLFHSEFQGPQMAYITSAERIGIEKGVKKGRQEMRLKSVEKVKKIAKNLLNEGMKPAFVRKTTGLSIAELKKLQPKLTQKKN